MTRSSSHPQQVNLSRGNWIAIATLVSGLLVAIVGGFYQLSKDNAAVRLTVASEFADIRAEVAGLEATMAMQSKQIERMQNQLDR